MEFQILKHQPGRTLLQYLWHLVSHQPLRLTSQVQALIILGNINVILNNVALERIKGSDETARGLVCIHVSYDETETIVGSQTMWLIFWCVNYDKTKPLTQKFSQCHILVIFYS